MRRPAIEALQRGIANLTANWQLVIVQFVQTVLVSILVVAGAMPFVLVIGIGTLHAIFSADFASSSAGGDAVEELLAAVSGATGALLAATVAATVVWTVAIVVHAYFQAGIFGLLAEGDEGAVSSPASRRDFRTFSVAAFRAAADRGMWTFFWLVNVFMLLGTAALAVIGGLSLLGALLAARDTAAGGIALGCVGGFLAVLVAIVASLWWQLAMASAASAEMSVLRSIATGAKVLVRRAGGVLVLGLLAVAVGMTAAIAFTPVGVVVELAFGDSMAVYVTAQALVSVVQSVLSAVIGIVFAGALVAIVRGEEPGERALPA